MCVNVFRQSTEVVIVKPFLTLGGEIHLYLITRLQALFALQEQFKNLRSPVHDGFIHVLQELEFNMDGVVHDLRETEPKTRCNGVAHPTLTSTALPNTHPESEIRERQDGFSRETTLWEADVSIHLL